MASKSVQSLLFATIYVLMSSLVLLGLYGMHLMPFHLSVPVAAAVYTVVFGWIAFTSYLMVFQDAQRQHRHRHQHASMFQHDQNKEKRHSILKPIVTGFIGISFTFVSLGLFYEWHEAITSVFHLHGLQITLGFVAIFALIGWMALIVNKRHNLHILAKMITKVFGQIGHRPFYVSAWMLITISSLYLVVGGLLFSQFLPLWSFALSATVMLTLFALVKFFNQPESNIMMKGSQLYFKHHDEQSKTITELEIVAFCQDNNTTMIKTIPDDQTIANNFLLCFHNSEYRKIPVSEKEFAKINFFRKPLIDKIGYHLDQIISVFTLLAHVTGEGGPSAQGLKATTGNWFIGAGGGLFAALAELGIDMDAIVDVPGHHHDHSHSSECHHHHNVTQQTEHQTQFSVKKVVFTVCASIFALAYGFCIGLLAYSVWPQFMTVLGLNHLSLTISGLGLPGYIASISFLVLGAVGCAIAILQSMLSLIHGETEHHCDGHSMRFFRDFIIPDCTMTAEKNSHSQQYYLRLMTMALVTLITGLMVGHFFTATMGINVALSTLVSLLVLHRSYYFFKNRTKTSVTQAVSSMFFGFMAFASSLLTGLVGALLFANLMGFGMGIVVVQSVAAVVTEWRFYRKCFHDITHQAMSGNQAHRANKLALCQSDLHVGNKLSLPPSRSDSHQHEGIGVALQ